MVGVKTASRVRLHALGEEDGGADQLWSLECTPETPPVWTTCTSMELIFSMISVWSRPRRMAATRRGGAIT